MLTAVQYHDPVLGLVFLAYAENRLQAVRVLVKSSAMSSTTFNGRRPCRVDQWRRPRW